MTTLNAYASGQTLQEIVSDCERQCNFPKYNLCVSGTDVGVEPTTEANMRLAPAYRWLLDILRGLYLSYDWPFLVTAMTITIPKATAAVTLPTNYWRQAAQDIFLWIVGIGGTPNFSQRVPIYGMDRETFFATYPTSTATQGTPRNCYIDRNQGYIYVSPLASDNMLAEFHFQQYPAGVKFGSDGVGADAITDVPWFPHHDYLKSALLVQYYMSLDDSRAPGAEQLRQQQFQKLRGANFDYNEGGRSGLFSGLESSVFLNPPNL